MEVQVKLKGSEALEYLNKKNSKYFFDEYREYIMMGIVFLGILGLIIWIRIGAGV